MKKIVLLKIIPAMRMSTLPAACLLMFLPALALAQTGPELLLKPWAKGERVEASGDVTFFNSGDTREGDDFQLTIYDTRGRARLWPEQRADPRFGYDITYLDLDTSNPGLPSTLVDTSVAFGMGIADYKGWLAGLTVGVGYAGAGAYDDSNAYYYKADLLLGFDIDETSSIGFVIDYDGNRTVYPDIPLPGFLYTKRLDTTLLLGIGFPFSSLEWKPNKQFTFDRQLTIEAKYQIPDDAQARIDYEFINTVGIFATYAIRQEAFHYDELPNAHDRILFQQRRVELGARWTPVPFASLVVAGGYAFSQEFNVGWDTFDQDRIARPSDEPFFRVGFEARF